MEPFRKKLRRWILGEKNQPPLSISEQKIDFKGCVFSHEQLNELSRIFRVFDEKFNFGFGFKYLMRVYKDLGITLDESEKKDFLRKSGYHRKMNQDSAGMTLGEFLEEINERFLKAKIENKDQFLDDFESSVKKLEGIVF